MSFTQRLRGHIIADHYAGFVQRGQRVLDIGCGNGVVSRVLESRLGIDLTGTDIKDYRREQVSFVGMGPCGRIPFPDKAFDVAMCNDVLHHTEDVAPVIAEALRVAVRVMVFEDAESSLLRFIDVRLNALYWKNMPCPLTFRSREEWGRVLAASGGCCRELPFRRPWWYPFTHFVFMVS